VNLRALQLQLSSSIFIHVFLSSVSLGIIPIAIIFFPLLLSFGIVFKEFMGVVKGTLALSYGIEI